MSAAKPTEIAKTETAVARIQAPPTIPDRFAQELTLAGIDTKAIAIPRVPHFWKCSWDELCTIPTRDPKTLASPICLIRNVVEMPEQPQEFDAYIGMIRIEFTTEDMYDLFVSHSRCYAATGEFLPLTEWIRTQPVPFAMRFGYIETRKAERHVVRPLPIDIPLT